MKLVVQRVKKAQVKRAVDGKVVGKIRQNEFISEGCRRGIAGSFPIYFICRYLRWKSAVLLTGR